MAVLSFFNFLKGANTGVSPFLMSPEMLTVLNGCNVSYKLGRITKEPGSVRVGSIMQSGKSIKDLYNFRQSSTTQKMLAMVDDSTSDDTQLFYSTGGAWTEITAAETAWANFATMDISVETFIGYAFFVGYGTTDGFLPVGSLTGTTFSTSTNIGGMAQGKFIVRYRDRLYVLNSKLGGVEYPYRSYFSPIPSAGALATWNSSGTDFFDVDYGEAITGGAAVWDKLVIFTEYGMWYYDQTQLKKVYDIGCSNHKTIKQLSSYLIWANADGVWLSSGGQPQNIGGEVLDFIRGSTPTTLFGTVVDEEYHLYVGTVTVDTVTYTNCELILNLPTQSWRWKERAKSITSMERFNSSGINRLYLGATDGGVYNQSKYADATIYSSDGAVSSTTDGSAMTATFETAPIIIDASKAKDIGEMIAYAERAQGVKFYARVIDKNVRVLTPYKPLGQLRDFINNFSIEVPLGAMIQIKGEEYSTNPYFSFYGFTLDVTDGGQLKKS